MLCQTSRNKQLDIAKGIGIILVVLGHQIDFFDVAFPMVYRYIYLFHVPLFFFLSGLFFNESESFRNCFEKKFRRLFVPFVLVNIFFFFVEMIRAWKLGMAYDGELGWKDLWLACIGGCPVPSMLADPSWFLLVLFRIILIYKFFMLLTGGRKWLMAVICVVLVFIGVEYAPRTYMLGQTMVALSFFCVGHICGVDLVMKKFFGTVDAVIGTLAALPLLYLISRHQHTNIAMNVYGNVVLMYLGASLGIFAVLWISKLMEKMPILANPISFIGQYTLSILIWHIFIMKVLFTVFEYVGWEGNPLIPIIAFIAGVFIPCVMSMLYCKMKNRIWSR